MSQPLRAVLFDYGHTLIHFDERPHAALLAAYQRVNDLLRTQLEREVPEAQVLIERVSLIVDQEIQRDYETGREEEVEIATLYDASLRQIGLELKPELIERVMELEQEGWIGSVHVGPDVVPTLEVIRGEGLKLGLVSNAAYLPSLMLGQLRALGLEQYFDGITFSSGIGWRKPHPAIYRDALKKIGVEAAAAVFVGDRLKEDVRGPQRLGMRAGLLREWRQEEDPEGLADFVIDRLGELPEVLARLRTGRSLPADTYN
ncbi:MAG: HAD family hydrolase [Chloroflexi bacterium]|nr:MAG: HAD family hydrolase [Chloroflexota bacterium]